MTIKAVIVDDEHLAINVIESFLKQIPNMEIVGTFENPLLAGEFLSQNKVDLLFLDIQMPQISGNNFLKTLKNPPLTVFTTAYSEYAVEAFELNVIDYLLKPVSFERLLKTINKVKEILQSTDPKESEKKQENNFLLVKADGQLFKVPFEDIQYVESDREYVKVFTPGKRYFYLETMKNLETLLPSSEFIRVHKSFIVAKSRVKSVDGTLLDIGVAKIPISREKKTAIIANIFK